MNIKEEIIYGSQIWSLTQDDQQKLLPFQCKVLKNIYEPIKQTGYSSRIRIRVVMAKKKKKKMYFYSSFNFP